MLQHDGDYPVFMFALRIQYKDQQRENDSFSAMILINELWLKALMPLSVANSSVGSGTAAAGNDFVGLVARSGRLRIDADICNWKGLKCHLWEQKCKTMHLRSIHQNKFVTFLLKFSYILLLWLCYAVLFKKSTTSVRVPFSISTPSRIVRILSKRIL